MDKQNDLLEFVENYQKLSRAQQAKIHMAFFRFEVNRFRKAPSLGSLGEAWTAFRVLVLPDIVYFATLPALVLAALLVWAWAVITGSPALHLAAFALAGAAYLKRSVFEKE